MTDQAAGAVLAERAACLTVLESLLADVQEALSDSVLFGEIDPETHAAETLRAEGAILGLQRALAAIKAR